MTSDPTKYDDDESGSPIMVDTDEDRMAPSMSDSVFDAFPPVKPEFKISPVDGIPVEVDPAYSIEEAYAPVLSEETLVCMAQHNEDGSDRLPKCAHYRRQMGTDDSLPGIQIIQRWCVALRGNNGSPLSIRDSAIPVCELRDPPDPRSTDKMDAIDQKLMKLGRERTYHQMFKTPEDVKAGRTKV